MQIGACSGVAHGQVPPRAAESQARHGPDFVLRMSTSGRYLGTGEAGCSNSPLRAVPGLAPHGSQKPVSRLSGILHPVVRLPRVLQAGCQTEPLLKIKLYIPAIK